MFFNSRTASSNEMFTGATTLLLLAGLVTVVTCAPTPTLDKSPSNEVMPVLDDGYLTKEEREQVVAGIILQIARDFDEGYITEDELLGRNSANAHEDNFARKGKEESGLSKEKSELSKEEVPPKTPPYPHTPPPTQTPALAT